LHSTHKSALASHIRLLELQKASPIASCASLKIAAFKEQYGLRQGDYRGQQRFDKPLYELLYECLDLYHRALINFGGEVAFGPTDIKPGSLTIQGMGADLFNQMGLATIPQGDLDPIIAELSK
jgi:hypothetical protein